MKWLKVLAYFLFAIVTFVGFLLTPWGAKTAISIANNTVAGLQIQHASGGLLGELRLSSVKWQSDGIALNVSQLVVEVDWSCSLSIAACVNQVQANSIDVQVKAVDSAPSNEPTELAKIQLPIPVSVKQLDLGQLTVNVENSLAFNWQALTAQVSMHDVLQISHLRLTSPVLTLLKSDDTTTQSEPAFNIEQISSWQYSPIVLPNLVIPIDANIRDLQITNLVVQERATQKPFNITNIVAVNTIQSSLTVADSALVVEQLAVNHELGTLSLEGELAPDYTHHFRALVSSNDNAPKQLTAKLNTQGSLKENTTQLDVSGDYQAKLLGKFNFSAGDLPIDLVIDWQGFSFPIDTKTVQLDAGSLSLVGTLKDYQLALSSGLQTDGVPPITFEVDGLINQQLFDLRTAKLNTLDGIIDLTGKLTLTDIAQWQGNIQVQDVHLNAFWPQLESQIQANIDHSAIYSGEQFAATIESFTANGNWLGYPLDAKGNAQYDLISGLNVPQLAISSGDNKLNADAQIDIDQQLNMHLSFSGNNLAQLYPELMGKITANADIAGSIEQPLIDYTLLAHDLSYQQSQIQKIESSGNVMWDDTQTISMTTELTNSNINGELIKSIQVILSGTADDHQIRTDVGANVMNIHSVIQGSLQPGSWSGIWQEGEFASQWGDYRLNNNSTELLVDWQNNQYSISPHCWQDQQANLCVNLAQYNQQNAQFDLEGRQLELLQIISKFTPALQSLSSETRLYFAASGNWDGQNPPIAQLNFNLSPAELNLQGFHRPIDMQKLQGVVTLEAQSVTGNIELITAQTGTALVDLMVNDLQDQRNLDGKISINSFLIAPFKEMVPDLTQLNGEINGDLAIQGTLKTPLLIGNLRVNDVNIAGELLPVRIENWNQQVEFSGQKALAKGEFLLGKGKGSSEGQFDWSGELTGDFTIRGNDFELEYRDIVRTKFSPDVTLKIDKASIDVNGKVDVSYARVKVKELPPEAYSPSDDVILVNQTEVEEEHTLPIKLNLQLNIDPKKANDVKLNAFGLTTDLQGKMSINQLDNKLTGHGDLNLVNGRYQAYGQDLVIRKGEIIFSGPMDSPTLDIEAIRDPNRTADDVIAGIRVSGQAEQPDVSIFSNPTMEQSQALSYLLQGKSLGAKGADTSNDAMLASVLINAGLSGSENRVNNLGRKLGIEDLALDASGSGDETQLSISGYIAPGVQLRYGVGVFDSSSIVSLRYQLMSQLYLEAVNGVENALDIYYQFTLGDNAENDE